MQYHRKRNAWNGATEQNEAETQNQTVIRSRELPKINDQIHEIEQERRC